MAVPLFSNQTFPSNNQENIGFSTPSKSKTVSHCETPLRDSSNATGFHEAHFIASETNSTDACDQLSVSILIEEDDSTTLEHGTAVNFDYTSIVDDESDFPPVVTTEHPSVEVVPYNLLQEMITLREQHAIEKKVLLEAIEQAKQDAKQTFSQELAIWRDRAEKAENLLRDQSKTIDSLVSEKQEMEQKQEELEQSETVFAEKLADLELAKATLDQQLGESEANFKKLSQRYEQLKQLYQDSLKVEQSKTVALANARQDLASSEAKCLALSQQVQELLTKSAEEVARLEGVRAREVALLQALLTAKELKTETTMATLQAEFALILSENRELHRVLGDMLASVDSQ